MSFGSNFPDGDWKAAALQAVPVLLSTAQAVSSQIQYNKLKKDIDNYQRQDIINPYANASNPYRNLGVATKAAEMKMEQADIALANTLDTLRSTGAAAGGATALAQAALQSKQGVAATIEQQELQNQRLVAKGEQMLQQQEARGKAFQFRAQEAREMQELNRLQAQADQARAQRVAATEAGVTALAKGLDTLAGGYTPVDKKSQRDLNVTKAGYDPTLEESYKSMQALGSPDSTEIDAKRATATPTMMDEGTPIMALEVDTENLQLAPAPNDYLPSGSPYFGPPMSSAAGLPMTSGVNLRPINQYIPVQNTNNPYNMPQGNMIGETYIDPATGLRLTR